MKQVAVLYALRDSVYKSIPNCDVWDEDRNAILWPGGSPCVAHPPCAQWCRMRAFARQDECRRLLALFAVNAVREWGGVLEHPFKSTLWQTAGLPKPGSYDEYGGYTLPVLQQWWGYPAYKATWLYIVGVSVESLPAIPFRMGAAELVVDTTKRDGSVAVMSKKLRARTCQSFAQFLVEVARRSNVGG